MAAGTLGVQMGSFWPPQVQTPGSREACSVRALAGFSRFQKQLSSPQAPCLMSRLTRTHPRTSWLLPLPPDGNPACGNALKGSPS